MSVETLTIAPAYLSIYVAGRNKVDIPMHMDRQGIFSSPHCINVPAYDWNRGDTNITFGPFDELEETTKPTFDGTIDTPDKRLIVFGALVPEYVSTTVSTTKTRIRIWLDHPIEPSNVIIAWG